MRILMCHILILGLLSCQQTRRIPIDCSQLSATFSGQLYMTYSSSVGHHTMSRSVVCALDSSHSPTSPPFSISYTHEEIALELSWNYALCTIDYVGTTTRSLPWDGSPWCTSFTFYPISQLSPRDTIFLSFTYTLHDST